MCLFGCTVLEVCRRYFFNILKIQTIAVVYLLVHFAFLRTDLNTPKCYPSLTWRGALSPKRRPQREGSLSTKVRSLEIENNTIGIYLPLFTTTANPSIVPPVPCFPTRNFCLKACNRARILAKNTRFCPFWVITPIIHRNAHI